MYIVCRVLRSNDKHIEVIVRQMLKKIRIERSGDADVLPGVSMDVLDFDDMNEKLVEEGKEPAEGKQIMLGITKASLATNSFLSAASFQETTKALTDAAINGKVDPLLGMKENVIIGKLLPVGTGMKRYRNLELNTDYQQSDIVDFSDDETETAGDDTIELSEDFDESDDADEAVKAAEEAFADDDDDTDADTDTDTDSDSTEVENTITGDPSADDAFVVWGWNDDIKNILDGPFAEQYPDLANVSYS
mgnify:CR=1 FL=1